MNRQPLRPLIPLLLAALLWIHGGLQPAAGANPIPIFVDGDLLEVEVPPVLTGGRVFIPLRAVSEALGAEVVWDPRRSQVSIRLRDTRLELRVGSREAEIDGKVLPMDAPPFIQHGRTLVPLRLVAETLGAVVGWDTASRSVRIRVAEGTTPPTQPPPGTGGEAGGETESTLRITGQIGGPTLAVAVQGHYAYVGRGLRLLILDVSNPGAIREVGATEPLGWYITDVAVSGRISVVATGGAGIAVVDISNPASPAVLGRYDTPGYAEAVALAGRYAYVADGPSGVKVVDISNPAKPVPVGGSSGSRYVFDVAVEGRYAYLAAAGGGMLVVEMTDPARPQEVAAYDTPGYAYGLSISGKTAYVADGWGGLRILDIADPLLPRETGSLDLPGWAFDIAVGDTWAYAATGWAGLQVIDLSDPDRPRRIDNPWRNRKTGAKTRIIPAWRVAVNQGRLYMTDRTGGLRIVDSSEPERLNLLGSDDTPGIAGRVAVAGSWAYLAGTYGFGGSELRVLDVEDPAWPRLVATSMPGGYKVVRLAGDQAYLFGGGPEGEGLAILDISDRRRPRSLSFQRLDGPPVNMFLGDGRVYVTTEFTFEVIGTADPAAPARLGVLDFNNGLGRAAGMSTAMGVSVSKDGDTAYVTHSGLGLVVIDISDPSKPEVVTAYKPPELQKSLSLVTEGDFAYLGDHSRIGIVDISRPENPRLLTIFPITGNAEEMVLADGLLHIAGGPAGVEVVDVSDPRKPALAGSRFLPGRTTGVSVEGGRIFAAAADGGLYILERPGRLPVKGAEVKTPAAVFQDPTHNELGDHRNNPEPGLPPSSPLLAQFKPRLKMQPRAAGLQSRLTAGIDGLGVGSGGKAVPVALGGGSGGGGRTWTVTSPADSGAGTLRWALGLAQPGDFIRFDPGVFPPGNPVTIRPSTGLPPLSRGGVTIDAGDAGVVLDGAAAPADTHGLVISSDRNTVKGLQIVNFPGVGIGIGGGSYNVIGGDRSRGRGPSGEGNTISGNRQAGIGIADCPANVASDFGASWCEETVTGNRIIGNHIGLDAPGTAVLGRQGTGIFIQSSTRNIVGGPAAADRNVISGNARAGVSLMGGWTRENRLEGNYIGTDAGGRLALGNDSSGVTIEGSADNVLAGNLISGNGFNGVIISDPGASGNAVIGNLIGTDAGGVNPLPNGGEGVGVNESFNRVGGTAPGEGNVISGNQDYGVRVGWLSTTGAVVIGNFIGTDRTGAKAVGNSAGGIVFREGAYRNFAGGTTGPERNLVSGNQGSPVRLEGPGLFYNLIAGNYIGLDAGGMKSLPNSGGAAVTGGEENFILGNRTVPE
ncbi:MAG: right-handed parallel beta-helix repeat-containing protein [Firmicutes bacterium]|nr:right-handed parallel beta-helix repeat-containing protein [Bacillota bacterium]